MDKDKRVENLITRIEEVEKTINAVIFLLKVKKDLYPIIPIKENKYLE